MLLEPGGLPLELRLLLLLLLIHPASFPLVRWCLVLLLVVL